jgi:hypothetical protein
MIKRDLIDTEVNAETIIGKDTGAQDAVARTSSNRHAIPSVESNSITTYLQITDCII